MLAVIDEFTRECLAIDASRRLTSEDVLERLSDLFIHRGPPENIRSNNEPEFTVHRVRTWLANVDIKTLFIGPGSPWENGFLEPFNGKFRDELLYMKLFDTLLEARVLIERWRIRDNTVRLHSSLDYIVGPEKAWIWRRSEIRSVLFRGGCCQAVRSGLRKMVCVRRAAAR